MLKFYKENGRWYADVPNHTQDENEMVCGADDFLEYISKGKSEVKVHVYTTPTLNSFMSKATFFMLKHDKSGATYQIVSSDQKLNGQTAWICNVTHDVLGEHPHYFFVNW